jgi:hypothetical protein
MLVDMANGKTFGQFGNNAIAYAGGVDSQYPGSDPGLAYPTIFSDPSFARRARTSFPQIVPHSIPAWRDTPLGISARDDDNFESKIDTCTAFDAKMETSTPWAAVDAAAMPDAPDDGDPVT